MAAAVPPDLLASLRNYFYLNVGFAASITPEDAGRWNSAYLWGNHASAGYALQSDLVVLQNRVSSLESYVPNWNLAYTQSTYLYNNRTETYIYSYTATGGETNITLPGSVATVPAIVIFFFTNSTSDGVIWLEGYRYTVSGNTINFTSALTAGNILKISYIRKVT